MLRKNAFYWFALVALLCGLMACSEDATTVPVELPVSAEDLACKGVSIDSVDNDERIVYATPNKESDGSCVLGSVEPFLKDGGVRAYLALDDDLEDPEVNWDSEVVDGTKISFKDTNCVSIVILDEYDRVVSVWQIVIPETPKSSSSVVLSSSAIVSSAANSSSSQIAETSSESSNGGEKVESSSTTIPESSSLNPESSSEIAEVESSSSVEPESSSVAEISSSSENVVESSAGQEQPTLSSEKAVLDVVVYAGSKIEATVDASNKKIVASVASVDLLSSIQVRKLEVSEGAFHSMPIRGSISFAKSATEWWVYEFEFTVTAEDGTSDSWKLVIDTPKGVALKDFIDGCKTLNGCVSITEKNGTVFIEMEYAAEPSYDMTALTVSPLKEAYDFTRAKQLEFLDALNELKTYRVVAGVQLPGSDFSARVDDFWGTTSDAMAKDVWVSAIHLFSSANLVVDDGTITLTSKAVSGSSVAYKLAGGFYFTGSYGGTSCNDIYNADGGYPDLGSSNITGLMTYGQPFTARPVSFDLTYAYTHVNNSDVSHPQKSLIYVLLVSKDNEVVASGMITDQESFTTQTKTVELKYGEVPDELLDGTYAVQNGLSQGTGNEDVATIHVMFASSAHAHVVANGSGSYRGGENSQLILDNFKLNY